MYLVTEGFGEEISSSDNSYTSEQRFSSNISEDIIAKDVKNVDITESDISDQTIGCSITNEALIINVELVQEIIDT